MPCLFCTHFEIHWGDETAVINTDVRGRSYSPKGETPVAYAPGSRSKLSMISTVTAMDRLTQQNAAMVEQSTAAAQSLVNESKSLKGAAQQFRVAGHRPARSRPRAAA
jgi:hypothetical protein